MGRKVKDINHKGSERGKEIRSCNTHSDCLATQYCDIYGDCYDCGEYAYHCDSHNGVCAEHCLVVDNEAYYYDIMDNCPWNDDDDNCQLFDLSTSGHCEGFPDGYDDPYYFSIGTEAYNNMFHPCFWYEGTILDCDCTCVNESYLSWLGDGKCDDTGGGQSEPYGFPNLSCVEFDYDNGDCHISIDHGCGLYNTVGIEINGNTFHCPVSTYYCPSSELAHWGNMELTNPNIPVCIPNGIGFESVNDGLCDCPAIGQNFCYDECEGNPTGYGGYILSCGLEKGNCQWGEVECPEDGSCHKLDSFVDPDDCDNLCGDPPECNSDIDCGGHPLICENNECVTAPCWQTQQLFTMGPDTYAHHNPCPDSAINGIVGACPPAGYIWNCNCEGFSPIEFLSDMRCHDGTHPEWGSENVNLVCYDDELYNSCECPCCIAQIPGDAAWPLDCNVNVIDVIAVVEYTLNCPQGPGSQNCMEPPSGNPYTQTLWDPWYAANIVPPFDGPNAEVNVTDIIGIVNIVLSRQLQRQPTEEETQHYIDKVFEMIRDDATRKLSKKSMRSKQVVRRGNKIHNK
tara:strand:+ start:576 stop:2279 length:1704 start_codon:yes stop_codon:yes gene_type:complete